MNAILNKILEQRKGHYCHTIEVSSTYELEVIAEEIMQEHEINHPLDVILEFLESLTVYYYTEEEESEEDEEAVYNFSFTDYINSTIN